MLRSSGVSPGAETVLVWFQTTADRTMKHPVVVEIRHVTLSSGPPTNCLWCDTAQVWHGFLASQQPSHSQAVTLGSTARSFVSSSVPFFISHASSSYPWLVLMSSPCFSLPPTLVLDDLNFLSLTILILDDENPTTCTPMMMPSQHSLLDHVISSTSSPALRPAFTTNSVLLAGQFTSTSNIIGKGSELPSWCVV